MGLFGCQRHVSVASSLRKRIRDIPNGCTFAWWGLPLIAFERFLQRDYETTQGGVGWVASSQERFWSQVGPCDFEFTDTSTACTL